MDLYIFTEIGCNLGEFDQYILIKWLRFWGQEKLNYAAGSSPMVAGLCS